MFSRIKARFALSVQEARNSMNLVDSDWIIWKALKAVTDIDNTETERIRKVDRLREVVKLLMPSERGEHDRA